MAGCNGNCNQGRNCTCGPPEDLRRFLTPTQVGSATSKFNREKPTHVQFPKELPRLVALRKAKQQAGREVRQFTYDARTGWASWL